MDKSKLKHLRKTNRMTSKNIKLNIPEGWTGTTLGSLMEFKNGLNKEKSAFGAGTHIVNYTDVYKKTSLDSDDVAGLVTVTKNELVNNSAQKGDVFFTRTSETLLEIGMASVLLDDIKDCVFSGYILRGRPNSNEVLSKYYAHSLRTPAIRKEIMRKSSMTTRALTTGKFLGAVEYFYPPGKEQERIIKTLDTWDEAIEKLDRVIRLKKDVKKGLMQKLLTGELRLPGFKGDWQTVTLGSVVKRVRRKNVGNNNNVLTISGQDGLVSQRDYFNKRVAAENLEGYTLVKRNEFAYNKSYSKGYPMGAIKRLDRYDAGVVSSLYLVFEVVDVDELFLDYYFQNGKFNKELTLVAQEGARNHGLLNISADDFFQCDIHIPSKDEQKAISQLFKVSDDEINYLIDKRDKIADQKKYLLNNLVTGQIRTPENL